MSDNMIYFILTVCYIMLGLCVLALGFMYPAVFLGIFIFVFGMGFLVSGFMSIFSGVKYYYESKKEK